ncbi:hypothetical protein L211DRAFT_396459 [Terfezia boudieri ATCC MYA-4762]|uniref:GPI inositol-deacylase n=1 Tax=Terfezia boudieri ATCC MYA-4762 TaxID=1051890 RepID=A0A3N4M7K0_9PEZI|nr:hypothetical protein L211DRAFT_396459 [Terfezia boudieri ATCC MYA-4762]
MKNPFHKLRRDSPAQASKQKLLENPWGISTVYTPPGRHKVDIFFTHGLGGGSRKTWAHDPCDYSTFWPGEWLPQEEGFKDARIHTFGYNANFQTGVTEYAILDFAREFIQELWISPLNFGNVPIILVGHSMGGLVSKKMYILAVNNQKLYHRIVPAIKAMLFLAVPHNGSGHSKSLNRILRMVPTTGRQHYINDLEISSETIRTINGLFINTMGDMMVASLYEVIPMKLAPGYHRMIVDPNHAILSLETEIIRPVSANHRTICKFSSRDDPNYAIVRDVLRAMVLQVVAEEGRAKFAERSEIPPYKGNVKNTGDEESWQAGPSDPDRVTGKGKELATTSSETPQIIAGDCGDDMDSSMASARATLSASNDAKDGVPVGVPDLLLGNNVVEEVRSCKHCPHCREKAIQKIALAAQA